LLDPAQTLHIGMFEQIKYKTGGNDNKPVNGIIDNLPLVEYFGHWDYLIAGLTMNPYRLVGPGATVLPDHVKGHTNYRKFHHKSNEQIPESGTRDHPFVL
jgi:hypothetical protein